MALTGSTHNHAYNLIDYVVADTPAEPTQPETPPFDDFNYYPDGY